MPVKNYARRVMLVALCLALTSLSVTSSAQTYRQQGIYPVFDGWEDLPDGSKLFYFGYMNRHTTQVTIPLGPDNNFEQSPADRLQPTNFLPGRNEHVFTVKVPKDFSGKLVWNLKTAVGAQKATASLDQLYILEIEEPEPGTPHLPKPQINAPAASVKLANALALVPQVKAEIPKREAVIEGSGARSAGVAVSWNKHRGPGDVTFSAPAGAPVVRAAAGGRGRPEAPPTPGVFTGQCAAPIDARCGAAMARFSEPGDYVLRAVAHQGREQGDVLVHVTVTP